jgi:glucokinase
MNLKVITVDLGGTKMQGVLVKDGKAIQQETVPTPNQPQKLFNELKSLIKKFTEPEVKGIKGIGLAVAGLVQNNQLLLTPNLPLANYPLTTKLENEFGLKVMMENDVNAFTWGEFRFGAAQGSRNIIGLTLGTGIGGGLVLNGSLYRGSDLAGEVGHMILKEDGPPCHHPGGQGCLESLASGWALERDVAAVIGKKEVEIKVLAEKARRGEVVFQGLFEKFGEYLGAGLATLANILNPDTIVLGGGLMKAADLFWKSMMESLQKRALSPNLKNLEVVEAALGNLSIPLGMADLFLQGD